MPVHRGNMARRVLASAPSITIASTTNYNQNIATFNATVNPNGASTDVKFQYSTNGTSWTDGATITGLTGGSQSVYSNKTGLTENTLYYVRAIATNSIGSNTSSNTTFTTWHLISFGTSSSTGVSIPTVTPTGGSTVVPSIYDVFMIGGGAGSYAGGGGAGGTYAASSVAFNNASNLSLTITVGGGGGAGANGGASSISNSSFTTITANGGSTSNGLNGGASGNGYSGGGYFTQSDGAKSPTFCYAYGGGGGSVNYGSAGYSSNGSYNGYAYGGSGGYQGYNSTWNVYYGGGGGGGYLSTNGGQSGSSGGGSYGVGGTCVGTTDNAGSGGAIWFKYYGP